MYDYDMYSKYVMFLFLVSIASWQKKKPKKQKQNNVHKNELLYEGFLFSDEYKIPSMLKYFFVSSSFSYFCFACHCCELATYLRGRRRYHS